MSRMSTERTNALCAGRVFIHPASINFDCGEFPSGWMVYSDITETSKVYVREASMVPVYALLLFGGKLTVHHVEGLISLDNWAKFKAPAQIATLVRPLCHLTMCAAEQVWSNHEAFSAVCRGPLYTKAEPRNELLVCYCAG